MVIYHSVPSQYFFTIYKENRIQIKNKKLNLEEKIINFFECYDTTNSVSDNDYVNGDMLFMHNLGFIENVNESDRDRD